MSMKQFDPPHPGAVIRRVYIEPFNLGSNEVARQLQVSPSTVYQRGQPRDLD